jgi:hypothetical protein
MKQKKMELLLSLEKSSNAVSLRLLVIWTQCGFNLGVAPFFQLADQYSFPAGFLLEDKRSRQLILTVHICKMTASSHSYSTYNQVV